MSSVKSRKNRNIVVLKSREKAARKVRHGQWFYSFIPFKIFTGGMSQLIPIIAIQEGGTSVDLGYLGGAGSLASMLGGVFWGRLSDKFGRRKVFLILGFIGSSLLAMGLILSTSVKSLIVLTFLYTFFVAATIPIPVSLISREFNKPKIGEATGRFNKIGGWAWVGGLLLGLALLMIIPAKGISLILGSIGILSAVIAVKNIRETPIHLHLKRVSPPTFFFLPRRVSLPKISTLNGELRMLFMSSMLLWAGSMLLLTQFPMLAKEKGFNGRLLYILGLASSTISAMTYLKVGRSLRGNGMHNFFLGQEVRVIALLVLGASIVLTGYAFLGVSILGYMLLGYSWSLMSVSSTAIIAHKSSKKTRGRIAGAYNFVSSGGAIAGNFASGYLASTIGIPGDFAAGVVLAGLSLIPTMKMVKAEGHPLNFGLLLRSRGRGLGL
ncbi:MFS transporter [Pyrococcus kukulkanii]|uniref:MFS transporter n=1 Tax=Pyrococcus kukulkanii TaxID=1609559 RepID=UPI003564918B